jgi:hypothetical protein
MSVDHRFLHLLRWPYHVDGRDATLPVLDLLISVPILIDLLVFIPVPDLLNYVDAHAIPPPTTLPRASLLHLHIL